MYTLHFEFLKSPKVESTPTALTLKDLENMQHSNFCQAFERTKVGLAPTKINRLGGAILLSFFQRNKGCRGNSSRLTCTAPCMQDKQSFTDAWIYKHVASLYTLAFTPTRSGLPSPSSFLSQAHSLSLSLLSKSTLAQWLRRLPQEWQFVCWLLNIPATG